MANQTINISMAFNEKYSSYAYVTLLSLFQSNPKSDIALYILHRDLSDKTLENIRSLCGNYGKQVTFLFIDEERINAELPTVNKWPVEVYFRLLLPDLLSPDIDRILYLDSDMIINKPLDDLYNTDLENYDLAACYDLCLQYATADLFLYYRHNSFKTLFDEKKYINSGMILFNLKRIRELYSFSVYLDALKGLDYKVYTPDQDLINYVHQDHILHLDPQRYNYPAFMAFNNGIDNEKAKKEIDIIHYMTDKPWLGGNHAHYCTEQIWWDMAYQTPYSEELMKAFIADANTDTTLISKVSGNDNEKAIILKENARLKQELNEAMESVKKVINMFSEQENK